MSSAKTHPVELLRDGKGIYGIGVSKYAPTGYLPKNLIVRRDRLQESQTYHQAVLQMITGGFRYGMFTSMSEEHHRQVIHHAMLCRAGLPWPPPQSPGSPNVQYWSSDCERQVRNRQIYHGLRLGSLSVVNRLIGQALEEAADPNALKLARRFRFRYRYQIYHAAALSSRMLQITAVFPALALAVFGFGGWSNRRPENVREHAARLIEAGAPLKTIADLMRVPMAFRKIKPGAADLALYAVDAFHDQRLIHAYMPDSLPQMKLWLRCIGLAKECGPEFVEWVAKQSPTISGTPNEVVSLLRDLMDWVQACDRASVPQHVINAFLGDDRFRAPRGEQFVVRPFSPDMSFRTATELCNDWHEAVANNMSGPRCEFPEPWCGPAEVHGYHIIPITNTAELYREGYALHHCVGTQGPRVQSGAAYFYSVRKNDERVATVELLRHRGGVVIGQLRGACNCQPPKNIVRAIKSWLRSQREFHFPGKHEFPHHSPFFEKDTVDLELPF
jgi:hypothetical protein